MAFALSLASCGGDKQKKEAPAATDQEERLLKQQLIQILCQIKELDQSKL